MRRINLLEAAGSDVEDAYNWYEDQRRGLGESFLANVRDAAARAAENPELFPQVLGKMRRALVAKFPYSVFFTSNEDDLFIHAVFHARRDPSYLWTR